MKIEIIESTVGDRRDLKAGAIEDVSDKDAHLLIRMRKARIPEIKEVAAATVDQIPEKEKKNGSKRRK